MKNDNDIGLFHTTRKATSGFELAARNNDGKPEQLILTGAFSYKGSIIKSYKSPKGEIVYIGEGVETKEFKKDMEDYYNAIQEFQKSLRR